MLVCGMVAKAQFVLTPQVGATLATITDTDDSKMKVGLVAGANLEYPITPKHLAFLAVCSIRCREQLLRMLMTKRSLIT